MEKDLEKAYFGVVMHDFNSDEFVHKNLFGSIRVLTSIATIRLRPCLQDKLKSVDETVKFCFFDTHGRVEYEMGLIPMVGNKEPEKVDVYYMYVEGNKKLLYDMVMNFSKASCKRVLAKYKRK